MRSKPMMRFMAMFLAIMISLTTSLSAFAIERPAEEDEKAVSAG